MSNEAKNYLKLCFSMAEIGGWAQCHSGKYLSRFPLKREGNVLKFTSVREEFSATFWLKK